MQPLNANANMQPLNLGVAIPSSSMEDNSSVGEVSPEDENSVQIRNLPRFGNTMQQASIDPVNSQMPHVAFPDPLQIEMDRIEKAIQEAHYIHEQKLLELKYNYDKKLQKLKEEHQILNHILNTSVIRHKMARDNYVTALQCAWHAKAVRLAQNQQSTGQVARPSSSSANAVSRHHIPPYIHAQSLEQPMAVERPSSSRALPVLWKFMPPQRVEQGIAVCAPFDTNPMEAVNSTSRRSIHPELINPHLNPMIQPNRRNLLHDGRDSSLTPAPPLGGASSSSNSIPKWQLPPR